MAQLTFIEKITLYFSCLLLGFVLHAQLTPPQMILEEKHTFLENDNKTVVQEELKHNNDLINILKPQNETINSLFYEQIKPIAETIINEMKVYHVYLGQHAAIKDALGWLKYHFKDKTFKSTFTYALYNNKRNDKLIEFDYRIKEPPPQAFLLAYFDDGQREGTNNTFTCDDLKKMGNGAKNLYYLWSTHPPLVPLNTNINSAPGIAFEPNNYELEIFYDKGTNFGGPSYLAIDKIALKDIRNQKIVAIYPINKKIEEPFVIFNYDFELKFPYYNYVQEGMLWNTNRIKSLKKIDLYEKKTKQKRTLYYDVE